METLTNILNKLFGLGSKAQLVILVGTHVLAVVVGIILGITFAKPTIIINKDENKQNNEGTVWGSDSVDPNSTLPSSSSYYSPGENSQYRTQLLQFMPPSPSI